MCSCSVAKSCLPLCNPMDCSPPGFSLHGIFQARILERVPFPLPGDLPDPGIEPVSPVSPELARRFFTTEQPGKPERVCIFLFLQDIANLFTVHLFFPLESSVLFRKY